MARVRSFTVGWTLCVHLLFTIGAAAFSGNFELTTLALDSPSEADPASSAGSFLSFYFTDQDTPNNPPVHCCLEWGAGRLPASIPVENTCTDNNVTLCVPEGQYLGFGNVTIRLAHSYEDDR